MAYIVYFMNSIKETIMNQEKSRVLLMVVMLYESSGDKDFKLSIYEYFDIIRSYLRDMTDNHKARGEWKIQLTMQIIFVSFIDANETRVMPTKSDTCSNHVWH